MNDLKSRIARHVVDLPKSGIRDFFDIVSNRKGVISLGVGEPDFDTPWRIREQAMFSLERGETHYTSNRGLIELRKALAHYVEKNFGTAYDPESEIVITVGVSEALDIALRALINPGDEVLYHEPCFVSYRSTILLAHGVPVPVETRLEDSFRLTCEMLEQKVTSKTRILLLNFPNNPTGAMLTRQDVEDISAFAKKHDLIVLTDEIYGELWYDQPHVSFLSVPGMKERTVFFHGFSKAWAMTGFRVGYVCAPAPLSDAMMKIHQYTMMCASTNAQRAALEAVTGSLQDVRPMVSEYARRRNFIYASFQEMGLKMHKPAGAFYAFPYIGDMGMTSKEFALRLLEEQNVAAVPGSAFGACGEGFLRCSYATGMEQIKEAMKRMAVFVKAVRK